MKRAGVESQRGYRAGIALIRSTMLSMQALGIAGGPWLDLAIRFWLAKGFLIGATLRMAMHAPLTMAFASPVSPTVDWLIASPLGATIATVCPILLLVGCVPVGSHSVSQVGSKTTREHVISRQRRSRGC